MVEETNPVGVPETVPVVVLKDRPDGNDGEIENEVRVPPTAVEVKLVMAAPLFAEMELTDSVKFPTPAVAAES